MKPAFNRKARLKLYKKALRDWQEEETLETCRGFCQYFKFTFEPLGIFIYPHVIFSMQLPELYAQKETPPEDIMHYFPTVSRSEDRCKRIEALKKAIELASVKVTCLKTFLELTGYARGVNHPDIVILKAKLRDFSIRGELAQDIMAFFQYNHKSK